MANPVPLEDLPANVVPASDLPGLSAAPAPAEDIGRIEAMLTGLEAAVDYGTGGLGSQINRVVASPLEHLKMLGRNLKKLGRNVKENLTINPENWLPTPERRAQEQAERAVTAQQRALEDENRQTQDVARQYRAYQARPGYFTGGAMVGTGATLFPGQTVELGTTMARNAAEGLAAREAALAQRGAARLLRNPGGVGKMAAESVGTPEKAEVLQSVLDNPAMRPHGGTGYPEQVVTEARNVLRQVGSQMDAAAARAGANGATVDMGAVLQDFRANMPSIIAKNPGAKTAVQSAEKFLVESAQARGGRFLSPKDAWDIRKQIDFEAFGLSGEANAERNLRSALQLDMRQALTDRLNPAIHEAGETNWLGLNRAYERAKRLEDIAVGGVKNVETAAAQPSKPLLKLRVLGSDVQPVAYLAGAEKTQRFNAARTRLQNAIAKGAERVAAGLYRAPPVPPELGPTPPYGPSSGPSPVTATPSPTPPVESLRARVEALRARRSEPGGILTGEGQTIDLPGAHWNARGEKPFAVWRPPAGAEAVLPHQPPVGVAPEPPAPAFGRPDPLSKELYPELFGPEAPKQVGARMKALRAKKGGK